MDLFTTKFHANVEIYRGGQSRDIKSSNHPLWFAESKDIAKRYGDHVSVFKVKKELDLLDISNCIFHLDYMSKINNTCIENMGLNALKGRLLAPLGLPDYDTQLKHVKKTKEGVYTPETKREENIRAFIDEHIGYFGGRHRYSVENSDGTKLDHAIVNALAKLYPHHDGYICKSMWPSYHQGGFLLPEICLFRPSESTEYVVSSAGGGGGRREKELLPYYIRKKYKMFKYIDDIAVLHKGH